MKHSERFVKLVEDVRERVPEITPEETLKKLMSGQPVVLIDVREESEWRQGHIHGAVHVGKGVIERDIEKEVEDPNTEIILYCGGGYRSVLAADNLRKMGYTNVASMIEGWRGWAERSYPTEKGEEGS